jgi:hypothetical protein
MGLYFSLRLLQIVIPWMLLPFRLAFMLMWTALSSVWVGVPQATNRMADEWGRRAVAARFINVVDRSLYNFIKAVALLAIVFGWVLLSFFTVWLVKWIF